jgi:hypothetical protein
VGGNPLSWVDPDGQLVFVPILGAMLVGAAIDVLIQTQIENKSLRCVNLTSTLVSAGLGAIPGSSLIKPYKAYKAAAKNEKGIRRILPKFSSQEKQDNMNDLLLAANLGAYSFIAGLEIPKFLPEYTLGDDCECQ